MARLLLSLIALLCLALSMSEATKQPEQQEQNPPRPVDDDDDDDVGDRDGDDSDDDDDDGDDDDGDDDDDDGEDGDNTRVVPGRCRLERLACVGEGTTCKDGRCVCMDGYVGNPFLACYPLGYAWCDLYNDPAGKMFNRKPTPAVKINLPCQFLFAYLTTVRKNRPKPCMCDVKVYVAEVRIVGKFAVSGVYVVLKFKRHPRKAETKRTYLLNVRGEANNGRYAYRLFIQSRGKLYRASDARMRAVFGQTFEFKFVRRLNAVVLKLDTCGLHLLFRAADKALGLLQLYMPGVALAVDEKNYDVEYLNVDQTFCMSSNSTDVDLGDVSTSFDLRADMAVMYKALVAPAPQRFFLVSNAVCKAANNVAKNDCNNKAVRHEALVACRFILCEPHFVRCYATARNSENLLRLYTKCLRAYCLQSKGMCTQVQNMVQNRNCTRGVQSETVGFNCRFLRND